MSSKQNKRRRKHRIRKKIRNNAARYIDDERISGISIYDASIVDFDSILRQSLLIRK